MNSEIYFSHQQSPVGRRAFVRASSMPSSRQSRIATLCALLGILVSANLNAATYSHREAPSSGGGLASAGLYRVVNSVGEVGSRRMQGGSYTLAGGSVSMLATPAPPPPVNPSAPVISQIPDQVIDEDGRTDILPFTFGDPDSRVDRLNFLWASSNPGLIPVSGLQFGGTGTNRTVRAIPLPNQFGSALLALTLSDGVHSNSMSFEVVVRQVNDAPALSRIVNAGVNEDTPTSEIQFIVGDLETPAAELIVTAEAADPALVPPGNITFGGSGANRWLKILPAPNQFGGTTITYRVSDGEATTERTFPFTVISNNDPPTVTPIADVSVPTGGSATVEFSIADVDHPLEQLNVLVQSDNSTLIGTAGLKRTDQGGGKHSLTLTPNADRTGIALITVTAVDPRGSAGRTQFRLAVGLGAQLDFGDAPQVYPTLLAANGARHEIKSGFFLGAGVDAEVNGQPNATATGDDANAPDDEDGVQFPTASSPAGAVVPTLYNSPAAQAANVITVTASAAGKLDAWLDLNRDGDWNDPGERLFTAQALIVGANTLTVTVPAAAPTGATFARFRFSSAGNLPPDGPASDGEVEDYLVQMASTPTVPKNLLDGLAFKLLGSAQTRMVGPGTIEFPNLAAQPNSGVSLELGQASGMQVQYSMQRENQVKHGILARLKGSQGGQLKTLATCKWEGPELDTAKNEVSIETIEIAHEGLEFARASVRFFNQRGRQIFAGQYGSGEFAGRWKIATPLKPVGLHDTGTHEVGHWVGIISSTPGSKLFADSPAGAGLHFAITTPGIITPRDSASGLPTGRQVTLPDGKIIEDAAFGVISFEGLKQPIDHLERAEILGTDGLNAFQLSNAGLLRDGWRVSGGTNTRVVDFREGGVNDTTHKFYALPEVDDEVLVNFSSATPGLDLNCLLYSCALLEFQIPEKVVSVPGSSFRLSSAQYNPKEIGIDKVFSVEVSVPVAPATLQLHANAPNTFQVKLRYIGPNATGTRFGVMAFGAGNQVEASALDGKGTDVNVEEVELVVTGSGRPTSVQPGLLRRGESSVQHGIAFDAPMTVKVGEKTFIADELFFKTMSGMDSETEVIEFRNSIQLRSPGQTEYHLAPQSPFDWGDAPFMTTFAQNGARHRILSGLRLGQRIDPERNGRPSPNAAGDDRDRLDDEDGVTFTSALVPGANATVNLAVVAPTTGAFVDAFIDWNANGAFEDVPGENVLEKQPVKSGINTFTIPVPSDAKLGKTFARFRLSTVGGLDCEGPAEDGEVEDYAIRIQSTAPPAHPSGLALVPRGGANLKTTAEGSIEASELSSGGDDGVTLLAPANVISRQAGRILLPLNPPIPLIEFESQTRPHADGLILEAHYTGGDGQAWTPQLKFIGGNPDRPVIVSAAWGAAGIDLKEIRVCGFNAQGYVGSAFSSSGELGSFNGNARIIRLGWATFPSSALVIFDGNVTFTGADGAKLTGNRFRFLLPVEFFFDTYEQGTDLINPTFTGLSIYANNMAGGLLGFSDLKVRNPASPLLKNLKLQPNGGIALEFTSQEDVFYTLEAADSLTSPNWKQPTLNYNFGNENSTGQLSDPGNGAPVRFFRIGVE